LPSGFISIKIPLIVLGWRFKKDEFLANELLLLYTIIGCTVFVAPCPLLLTLLGVDPFSSVISVLLLDHPYYHTISDMLYTAAVSLIGFSFGLYIVYKQVLVFVVIETVFGITSTSLVSTLKESVDLSSQKVMKGFCAFQVIFKISNKFTSDVTGTLVVFSFIICSLFPWLWIRCFYILPFFIPVAAMAATLVAVALSVYILQLLNGIHIRSKELVESQRARYFTFNRSKKNYYYTCRWKAVQPLRLNCGGLLPLSRNVIKTYLNALNTSVFDAVLLIDP